MKFLYKTLLISWLLICSTTILPSDNVQYLKPLILGIFTGIAFLKIKSFFSPSRVVIQSASHSNVVYQTEGQETTIIERIIVAEGGVVTVNGQNVQVQPQEERAERSIGLTIGAALVGGGLVGGTVALYYGQQYIKK